MKLKIYPGTDTAYKYNAENIDGSPFDLDTENITKVEIKACGLKTQYLSDTDIIISSEDNDILWAGDIITFILGRLNLPKGDYIGKVKFYNNDKPNGFVVHELQLVVGC